jgi:hypothetical protein
MEENSNNNYDSIIGKKFKPTFESNISYFKIRGYDKERDMVLTTAFPKEGEPFDDEIEARYLLGAFETGDYEKVQEIYEKEQTYNLYLNPYYSLMGGGKPLEVVFTGPCCARCRHRFGNTSNSEWCATHYKSENCYRFKL